MVKILLYYQRTICFLVPALLIAILVGMPVQAQQVDKSNAIAVESKVIITGQLVRKDGSTVTYGKVGIYEAIGEQEYSTKYGEDGVFLNPECKVNDEGRFRIELDLDVFEGAERFLLLARLDPFVTRLSPLYDRKGTIIMFEFSGGSKNLDLGAIIVE